jgi:hypothetical protein
LVAIIIVKKLIIHVLVYVVIKEIRVHDANLRIGSKIIRDKKI